MNILNFSYTIKAAIRAKERGVGVGVMSPLSGGLIPMHEDKLRSLCKSEISPTAEALRFVCGLDFVDFSYVGFKSKSEIDEACRIADLDVHITPEALKDIKGLVGENLQHACTGCMYCMEYCPKALPISEYMSFYNLKHVFHIEEDELLRRLRGARDWFMLAKRKADAKDCISCGSCEQQCTQKINIIDRLSEIAQWESQL